MNATISVSVAEVSEEFEKDFVAWKFSTDDLGVEVGGINSFEVCGIYRVLIVTDEFVEGVVDNGLSLGINWHLSIYSNKL